MNTTVDRRRFNADCSPCSSFQGNQNESYKKRGIQRLQSSLTNKWNHLYSIMTILLHYIAGLRWTYVHSKKSVVSGNQRMVNTKN